MLYQNQTHLCCTIARTEHHWLPGAGITLVMPREGSASPRQGLF